MPTDSAPINETLKPTRSKLFRQVCTYFNEKLRSWLHSDTNLPSHAN